MKILTKIVLAVESSLITTAYWLWKAITQRIVLIGEKITHFFPSSTYEDKIIRAFKVITETIYHEEAVTIYPYQTLSMILLIVTGCIGIGYLLYYLKKRSGIMPKNYLQGWKRS